MLPDFPLDQFTICTVCFALRGPCSYYEQTCDCDRDERPIGGRDFNLWAELCYCCAAEAIRSGSRWSSFHCDDCETGRELPIKHLQVEGRPAPE